MADSDISLAALIAELRKELTTAKSQGQGSDLRFQVEEAEIELQVVVTQGDEIGGGVKFWVLNAAVKDKFSEAITQKIKLKLKPLDADGGNTKISAKE